MSYLDRKDLLSADLVTRSITKEGSIKYYNTDKNVANIYMKLMAESPDGAQKEVSVDEASNYTVKIDVIKPKTNQIRTVPGVLSTDLTDETCAIWKFELGEDLTNQIGEVICQTYVKNTTQNLTMRYFAYTVEADKLTGLNSEIVTDPDLPILKELIKEVQETAQTVNNIDNVNVSDTKTYSNKKIEEKFTNVDAQFNTIEQKKADKTEVDIERKRLDNIIANNNNTEGNSELVDVRIGADGTVYDCAGKSVREQFNTNNTKIQESASKNTEQDTRLINIEQKNKVQDVYLNGLFNENNDGRLTIEGAGNHLKLEGSKSGLVTVDSVVGDTMVNIVKSYDMNNFGKTNCTQDGDLFTLMHGANVNACSMRPKANVHMYKANTKYTVVVDIKENTANTKLGLSAIQSPLLPITPRDFPNTLGISTLLIQTTADLKDNNEQEPVANLYFGIWLDGGDLTKYIKFKYWVLEGDYTNKPIPKQVFTGIQSSFEENKVTQEVVDSGKELASNLGKYKVSAKVVGKNLFDGKLVAGKYDNDNGNFVLNPNITANLNIVNVKPSTDYYLNRVNLENVIYTRVFFYDNNKNYLGTFLINANNSGNGVFTTPSNCTYINFQLATTLFNPVSKVQIEEGTVATPFETYFESKHNIYLNSPLLKGDVLECRGDGVYHVHNGCRKTFNGGTDEPWVLNKTDTNTVLFQIDLNPKGKDFPLITTFGKAIGSGISIKDEESVQIYIMGTSIFYVRVNKSRIDMQYPVTRFKAWLQANPITVIYELAEPYEEKVSDNKFLCEIANGSTLHLDSNIPCTNIKTTYTSNVVSVVKLDKIQYQQDQMNLDNVYRLTMLETTIGI